MTAALSPEQIKAFSALVLKQTAEGRLHWRSYRGHHHVADHSAGLLTVVHHDDIPGAEPTLMVESTAIVHGPQAGQILTLIEEQRRDQQQSSNAKDRAAVLRAIGAHP